MYLRFFTLQCVPAVSLHCPGVFLTRAFFFFIDVEGILVCDVYSFSVAAVTNVHKLSGLKPCRLIISQSVGEKSGSRGRFHEAEIKMLAG